MLINVWNLSVLYVHVGISEVIMLVIVYCGSLILHLKHHACRFITLC